MKPIPLNGSQGGGQILRSALSLSMATGQAFRLTHIRGKRPKPGLKRQHLTCVKAAAEISGGSVDGAELNSLEIVFRPGEVKGGDYHYAIGTAGSTTLLAQTLLPALWPTGQGANLHLEGGTHNPMAPPFEFITHCYLPALQPMGAMASCTLECPGFAPAGGGSLKIKVEPCRGLAPIDILERGEEKSRAIECLTAHINPGVAERELSAALRTLDWPPDCASNTDMPESSGPGNVLSAEIAFKNITERVSSFGAYGKSSKQVAKDVSKSIKDYLSSGAVVGRRLADQLLLPFALAGGGSFITMTPSNHLETNREVIQSFLPVKIAFEDQGSGRWLVTVT